MRGRTALFAGVLLAAVGAFASAGRAADAPAAPKRPNVIVILADDLGYGDVGCYGATKVKTPNLDRLAAQGLRFTDGHASSATCTPSRYALLTGEYAWRRKGTNILPGDAPLVIEPGRATLPSVLKSTGYATGVVGKWHLGLGPAGGRADWNGDITPGALDLGFDYAFLIPATGDRVPCVYVENRRVVGLDPADPIRVSYGTKVGDEPTGKENPDLLKVTTTHGHDNTIVNGIGRIGFMAGGKSARWVDQDMADVVTAKAVQFIERQKDGPFFLFFSTHDVHVPRAPHARFAGTSGCGVRGDVIHQLDWSVGQVMNALDRLKLADDTLVLFSSDTGPVVDDGYADGSVESLNGHVPAGPLRGGKYTLYEGGTRVPFIVRYPRRVKPGVSDALVCQVDLMASLAALAGKDAPGAGGPDGMNVLPALLGQPGAAGRDSLIEQGGGVALAVRKGPWKLIPRNNRPAAAELYNLAEDLGETRNVAAERPEVVRELSSLLREARQNAAAR